MFIPLDGPSFGVSDCRKRRYVIPNVDPLPAMLRLERSQTSLKPNLWRRYTIFRHHENFHRRSKYGITIIFTRRGNQYRRTWRHQRAAWKGIHRGIPSKSLHQEEIAIQLVHQIENSCDVIKHLHEDGVVGIKEIALIKIPVSRLDGRIGENLSSEIMAKL